MTYYKKKPKTKLHQSPFFLGTVGTLLLFLVAFIGYQLGKSQSTQVPTTATTMPERTVNSVSLEDASLAQDTQAIDQTQDSTTNNEVIPAITETYRPAQDNTPISANAHSILQSQKNNPVVWEMSQQDPTRARQTASTASVATQPVPTPTAQPAPPPTITQPIPSEASAPIGNQSVLHADDVPANEHKNLEHLNTPNPPTIQPRVKIQSSKKDSDGNPVQSLEIE